MIEFPQTYSALLIGLPGVGKSEYCMHLAKTYLLAGEKVVYVTTEKSPSDIRERMAEMGLGLGSREGRDFVFIDVFTRNSGEKEGSVLYVENPSNLNMVSVRLQEALEVVGKPARIIFDSLSTFFLHASENEIRSFFESVNTKIKMEQSFALFALHEEMHDEKVVIALKAMVLSVIEMVIEDDPGRTRKARVAFAKKGVQHSPDWFEFKIEKGGVEFMPFKGEETAGGKKEKPKRGKLFKIARAVAVILAALILIGIISGGDKDQDTYKSGRPVYFYENFDDGAAWGQPPGWEVKFPYGDENGMLVSDRNGVFFNAFGDEWENYAFMFRVKYDQPTGFNMRAFVRSTADGRYSVFLSGDRINLVKNVQAEGIDLASAEYMFESGQSYDIKIEVSGMYINVFVNDEQVLGFTDVEDPYTAGGVGFESFDCEVFIDEVIVESMDDVQFAQGGQEAIECPECPPADEWSECTDGKVTRQNYRCDSSTGFQCESFMEEERCQLTLGGMGDLTAVIEPTIGKTVSGTIGIEATSVPKGTVMVTFMFFPADVQLGSEMSEEDRMRLLRDQDTDGEDGWSTEINTLAVENGPYTLFVGASDKTGDDQGPGSTFAVKQVIVEN